MGCISFVAGGAVARADPDSVALHPGWRKAVALAYTARSWEEGASGEVVRQTHQQIAQDVRRLEPISPDSATYMNEVSIEKKLVLSSTDSGVLPLRRPCTNPILEGHSLGATIISCNPSSANMTPSRCL